MLACDYKDKLSKFVYVHVHTGDNTRMLVTIGICFKQHFDTTYFAFCNLSPPRMFLPLDLLSEYRIQHGTIGPLYVTSSHSTIGCFTGEFHALQLIVLVSFDVVD